MSIPKNQKINPRAIAVGFALNTILFMAAAYGYTLVAGLIFFVLASSKKLTSPQPDTLFVAILCTGWLVVKVFCEFAAGVGVASLERVHTRINLLVLMAISLVVTVAGAFIITDALWPIATPLWYIFASPLAAFLMPLAGALFFRWRASKAPKAVPSSAPPLPEVPPH